MRQFRDVLVAHDVESKPTGWVPGTVQWCAKYICCVHCIPYVYTYFVGWWIIVCWWILGTLSGGMQNTYAWYIVYTPYIHILVWHCMLKRQVYFSRVLRNMKDFRNSIDLTQPTAAAIHGRTHKHQKTLFFFNLVGVLLNMHIWLRMIKKQILHFKLPNMSYWQLAWCSPWITTVNATTFFQTIEFLEPKLKYKCLWPCRLHPNISTLRPGLAECANLLK